MRFCTLLGLLFDYAFFAEGAKQTAKDAIVMLAPRLASIQFAPRLADFIGIAPALVKIRSL